jgi:uncharacterized protein (DUF1330 family)
LAGRVWSADTTAYLINHLRQPGVVSSEVLDYLEQVQATLDPFGGRFWCRAPRQRCSKGDGPSR